MLGLYGKMDKYTLENRQGRKKIDKCRSGFLVYFESIEP